MMTVNVSNLLNIKNLVGILKFVPNKVFEALFLMF